MSFFDAFRKKKDDFGFSSDNSGLGEPPIDSHSTIDNPIGTKDIFTLPSSHSSSINNPHMDHGMSMPLGESMSKNMIDNSHSSFSAGSHNPLKQDFELLSSKLDYLKASIEAVNQRLANLEHLVRQEQDRKKW